jgi:hypothetical protein
MEKRTQIISRLVLGDYLVQSLGELDDPETARALSEWLWHGIDPDGHDHRRGRDDQFDRRTDVNDTGDRDDILGRLVEADVVHPASVLCTEVIDSVVVDAYELGRSDAAENTDENGT